MSELDRIAANAAENPLPRELAPGIFWFGNCMHVETGDRTLHSYNSSFLVQGDEASALVEAGCIQDLPITMAQLESVLVQGGPPLRYLFCTHEETPHAGGVGWVLERFPEVTLIGDVRDYHLYFPEYVDRFRPMDIGDEVDLGGTQLQICEPILRDLVSTQWAFDTRRRTLFPGDGFAYTHYHQAGHCGHTAEETRGLPIPEMTAMFADAALYWTRFTEMEPYASRLEEFLHEDLGDVRLIAPTHGLPITDPDTTMREVLAGLVGAI